MGSEGPSVVTVHVTGFKKFHGVAENPTEAIVGNLKQFLEKKGLPKGLVLGSCNVLETAGQGALDPLYQILESAVPTAPPESSTSARIIWNFGFPPNFGRPLLIHNTSEFDILIYHGEALDEENALVYGPAAHSQWDPLKVIAKVTCSGASRFAIEHQAVNEATFRCPDQLGWKPQKALIVPADGSISQTRETNLPVDKITKALAKMGYDVMTSHDAGRFVCNYVYYHSLRFADQHGIQSLFVHVPLFLTIEEETQMQFAASLLEVLASLN